MRSALREAEVTPPSDGWMRLEQELPVAPAPRVVPLRRRWLQICATAAAVMVFVGGGGYLFFTDHSPKDSNIVALVDTNTPPPANATSADDGMLPSSTEAPSNAKRPGLPTKQEVMSATLPGSTSDTSVTPSEASPTPALAMASDASNAAPKTDGMTSKVRISDNTTAESALLKSENQEDKQLNSSMPAERQAKNADALGGASEASDHVSEHRSLSAQPRTYAGMYDYADEGNLAGVAKKRNQLSVAVSAAGGLKTSDNGAGGMLYSQMMSDALIGNGDIDGAMAMLKYKYDDYSFRHHQPLSFGLSVRYAFPHGLSLESGLNYTLLRADVGMPGGNKDISQKLHFIGIPVRLNWSFLQRGGFSLYIGGGFMAEKCVSAKFGSESINEPKVQWSVNGLVGAQYQFGKLVGLYFEPEVSHYFTETRLRTSRSDSSADFTLRLGVRFMF